MIEEPTLPTLEASAPAAPRAYYPATIRGGVPQDRCDRPFPQWAKTTDPEAIRVYQDNLERHAAFLKEARELLREATGDPNLSAVLISGALAMGQSLAGVPATQDLSKSPGPWLKATRQGNRRPAKKHPLREEIDKAYYEMNPVGGRPNHLLGMVTGSFQTMFYWGQLFLHEDVLYQSLPLPAGVEPQNSWDGETGGWVEIQQSEFIAAAEAYNDALDAARDTAGKE